MTYQKHSVSTDALDTLGTIIGPEEGRDAIHLAVENAVAHTRLAPGQHVVLGADGAASPTGVGDGVGIVDPFLERNVEPGERFWLVVYPRQITSLRHVWEHPDFPASGETGPVESAAPDKDASEQWLRAWCANADCPGFDAVMAVILDGSWSDGEWSSGRNDGEYLFFDGSDAHGVIPEEFWDHVEVYTGRTFSKDDRAEGFACSC